MSDTLPCALLLRAVAITITVAITIAVTVPIAVAIAAQVGAVKYERHVDKLLLTVHLPDVRKGTAVEAPCTHYEYREIGHPARTTNIVRSATLLVTMASATSPTGTPSAMI